jgi:acyl-CoA synthetase (AMP-forming)/AMP-acid ligase II
LGIVASFADTNRRTARSYVEVLRRQAERQPDAEAFAFLDGEGGAETVTYAMLDARARAVAGAIQRTGAGAGERAVLLYPPGLSYIYALFGCMYAGTVAVPAYPPDPARLNRTVPRLLAIVGDAKASLILTLEAIRNVAGELFGRELGSTDVPELATDVDIERAEEDWEDPNTAIDDLAVLQYTSGSTSSPRGVMLSHANLLANSEFIYRGFGSGPDSRAMLWLPPYHDMGLIGGILQPTYGGFPMALMSPLVFLRRPYRWLRAVSDYRATISGGPNFAFDMCVRRITPEQREELDLSAWELAFDGAEPVRQSTIDVFSETFGPSGFRREAFYPCYGLAEGTLMITGGRQLEPLQMLTVDAELLCDEQQASEPRPAHPVASLVGCGRADVGHEVTIADPVSLRQRRDGGVGEIWARGPSVAGGYWGSPQDSEATFSARLADDGSGPYLRTGDLGFMQDGELYVTGRIKDLIVVAGRNFYPTDIEVACEGVAGLRRNCGAAFSVENGERESVVVVHEVADDPELDHSRVIDEIRRSVARTLDLQVNGVALIRARSMPKTSSGKVQRWICRSQYLERSLELLTEWSSEDRAA